MSLEQFRQALQNLGYLYGRREDPLTKLAFKILQTDKSVSFENLAMFLNLINNVYLPSFDDKINS